MEIPETTLPQTTNPVVGNQQTGLDELAMSALLRKIDLRLLPCLTIIYFFNYLGRVNTGNNEY